MPDKPDQTEVLKHTLDTLARFNGNINQAAGALGIARSTLQARKVRALALKLAPGPLVSDDAAALRDRVFELETQMRAYKAAELTDEYVKRKIIGLSKAVREQYVPAWLSNPERGKGLPGAPATIWSDWHAGEIVDPTQINGVNEYNMAILEERVKRLVRSTINLLQNHVVNPKYPGLVLMLGGDMLSGDIHEELKESNEKPTMAVLVDLVAILTAAIRALLKVFKRLFIPCVTGNHGRNSKKPRAKGRNFENFDWLCYQFLQLSFAQEVKDGSVTFFIPNGPDASFEIYGHKYLLTHGDQFRGGDSMIGALGPILRGRHKKLSRNAGIGLDFDTMVIGHWHRYLPLKEVIVNGSLKGYDEYAARENFGYEVPIQALWLTHPQYGIRMHLPVYLEDRPQNRGVTRDWVVWNGNILE